MDQYEIARELYEKQPPGKLREDGWEHHGVGQAFHVIMSSELTPSFVHWMADVLAVRQDLRDKGLLTDTLRFDTIAWQGHTE